MNQRTFPLPDTPVTQIIVPKGSLDWGFRLLPLAEHKEFLIFSLNLGTSIFKPRGMGSDIFCLKNSWGFTAATI